MPDFFFWYKGISKFEGVGLNGGGEKALAFMFSSFSYVGNEF